MLSLMGCSVLNIVGQLPKAFSGAILSFQYEVVFLGMLIFHEINRSVIHFFKQSISQSLNQSLNRSIDQSAN